MTVISWVEQWFNLTQRFPGKKIAPAALQALKEALTHAYRYKTDLRSFLTQCLEDSRILSKLNWEGCKRNIVARLADSLARDEDSHQQQLLNLMIEVASIRDFSHLARLEDGQQKVELAQAAVKGLREQLSGLGAFLDEEREIERRRGEAHAKRERIGSVQQALETLKTSYFGLFSSENPQGIGYQLEKILRDLFDVCDLDPQASFKIKGEQIDGAFTFDGAEYLLEAKWQQELVPAKDLDSFASKISRSWTIRWAFTSP